MPNAYVTVQGDTWDYISFKAYGIETQVGELIDANPDQRNVTVFSAGVALTIPDASDISTIPQSVPPWKRGDS